MKTVVSHVIVSAVVETAAEMFSKRAPRPLLLLLLLRHDSRHVNSSPGGCTCVCVCVCTVPHPSSLLPPPLLPLTDRRFLAFISFILITFLLATRWAQSLPPLDLSPDSLIRYNVIDILVFPAAILKRKCSI
jgi:hypothetical protein